jgi:hypothetical protein
MVISGRWNYRILQKDMVQKASLAFEFLAAAPSKDRSPWKRADLIL